MSKPDTIDKILLSILLLIGGMALLLLLAGLTFAVFKVTGSAFASVAFICFLISAGASIYTLLGHLKW